MKRSVRRWVLLGSVGITIGLAAACGGGDDTNGNDSNDGGGGGDATKSDGSPGTDSGSNDSGSSDAGGDSGPVCNVSPCTIQIAAAGDFTCALLSDKTIRCWGANTFGQLAVGATDDDGGFDAAPYSVPHAIALPNPIDEVATGDFFVQSGITCARSGTTDIQCWGSDVGGQLARDAAVPGALTPHPDPAPVNGLTSAKQLALLGGHDCALTPSGNVSCWGLNVDSCLGRASATLYNNADLIEGGTANYVQITAGEADSCALTVNGTVDCWGWNFYGQLGVGDAAAPNNVVPTTVPGLTGVAQLVAGDGWYCARLQSGGIDCWGRDGDGQLGQGIRGPNDATPLPVLLPAGRTARLIGGGTLSMCAALDDDTLWCWGRNLFGGLGSLDDASVDSGADGGPDSVPRKVDGITGHVLQIAGGVNHMCTLLEGGQIECWGANNAGQLGRGAGDGGDPDGIAHPDPKPVAF